MNTAIICPGPSLTKTFLKHFDGRVIAVNRAARQFDSDVWVCGDWELYEAVHRTVCGLPKLLCPRSTTIQARHHEIPWRGDVIEYESLYGRMAMHHDWQWSTLTVAIAYAAKTAQSEYPEIDLFGADWSGTADFDGATEFAPAKPFRDRSPRRWQDEMTKVMELGLRLHVKIRRHLPDREPTRLT